MKIIIHKNKDRGTADHGWLKTKFSFSFADWYEASRMGFGNLRVINDDTIMPNSGFGMHPHNNMEIITIVTKGEVTHEDSMGNNKKVVAGEIQVMSAGSGVVHSEYNKSGEEILKLYQIWILPREENIKPSYGQKDFKKAQDVNDLTMLVSPDGEDDSLSINQDAYIYRGLFNEGKKTSYDLKNKNNGVYIFVVRGEVKIDEVILEEGDAAGINEVSTLDMGFVANTEILLFEV